MKIRWPFDTHPAAVFACTLSIVLMGWILASFVDVTANNMPFEYGTIASWNFFEVLARIFK